MLRDLLDLALAFALAVPIGYNREREAHRAGIRTFPIVAIASCALIMVAGQFKGATPDVSSRTLQGLITGIGFIGGGAIVKDKGMVTGTATAASIWSTAIVGAAVAFHVYHVAIALTAVTLLTLLFMAPLKSDLGRPEPNGGGSSLTTP